MKTLSWMILIALFSIAGARAEYSAPIMPVDISRWHCIADDFVQPTGGQGAFQLTNSLSGTGANITSLASVAGHLGLLTITTGTTTTGSAQQVANGGLQPFRFDTATYKAEWVGRLTTLSDGTDTYAYGMGLADMDTGVPIPVQAGLGGAWFRYTSTTNSGKWQGCTASGGPANTTCTDTGIAADTSFHRWTIDVLQSGNVKFSIDDALVATNSSNIPTTAPANFHWRINKSAGTTARTFLIDAYSLCYTYGTRR
jgi:hypothetical protein